MICTQCHLDQPLEDYARATRAKNGRQQPCNTCRYSKAHLTRLANPESRLARWQQSDWECHLCHAIKPVDAFRTKQTARLGHIQPCKECYNAVLREKRTLDPAPSKAAYQRWLATHRDQELQRSRQRHATHPEQMRQWGRAWSARNPVKRRIKYAKRRLREREVPHTFTEEERAFMLQYWSYACVVCHREVGLFDHTLSDDHVIPLSHPQCPGTVATNILPLCHGVDGCNNSKAERELLPWLIARVGKRKATIINTKIATYFAIVAQRTQTAP